MVGARLDIPQAIVWNSHAALSKDICVNDRKTHKNFCRMDTVDYDELPSLVEASITTQDM